MGNSNNDTSDCVAEFTIEPFEEGNPGPHVTEAVSAVERTGLEVDMGPFGTAVRGTPEEVSRAMAAALETSMSEGASRVSVTVSRPDPDVGEVPSHPLLQAIQPVLQAVGAEPVAPSRLSRHDVAIEWEGEVIGGIRLPSLEGALKRMVEQIAADHGGDLTRLGRVEKQQVVRALNERGAFALRGAVEEVADMMGVSRITVYNYLNATRPDPGSTVNAAR